MITTNYSNTQNTSFGRKFPARAVYEVIAGVHSDNKAANSLRQFLATNDERWMSLGRGAAYVVPDATFQTRLKDSNPELFLPHTPVSRSANDVFNVNLSLADRKKWTAKQLEANGNKKIDVRRSVDTYMADLTSREAVGSSPAKISSAVNGLLGEMIHRPVATYEKVAKAVQKMAVDKEIALEEGLKTITKEGRLESYQMLCDDLCAESCHTSQEDVLRMMTGIKKPFAIDTLKANLEKVPHLGLKTKATGLIIKAKTHAVAGLVKPAVEQIHTENPEFVKFVRSLGEKD